MLPVRVGGAQGDALDPVLRADDQVAVLVEVGDRQAVGAEVGAGDVGPRPEGAVPAAPQDASPWPRGSASVSMSLSSLWS